MNIKNEKGRIISDTRKFLENAMAKPKVVIGISGGKDSAIAAAICCEAIGKDNVIGVMLPDGIQKDIGDSEKVCKILGIHYQCHDISTATSFIKRLSGVQNDNNRASRINVPPRVRMTVLRYIAQSEGALLCGTGNYSERYVGYFTKDGDGSCDFNPLGHLTSIEVVQIGELFDMLPRDIVHKTPDDGLSGISDEEKLGVTYRQIHDYIRSGTSGSDDADRKIKSLHKTSCHKRRMPQMI